MQFNQNNNNNNKKDYLFEFFSKGLIYVGGLCKNHP